MPICEWGKGWYCTDTTFPGHWVSPKTTTEVSKKNVTEKISRKLFMEVHLSRDG
jgi:hypothetical protein